MVALRMHGRLDGVFLALVLVAIAARLLVVWLFPPLLDVYYYDVQAASALLHGMSPYGHLYSGIPKWLATPGAEDVFAYFPGVALYLVPFAALGDFRFGLILADVVVAFCINSLGGRRAVESSALYLLLPSTVLFSTLYPNNTLVAALFVSLSLIFESRGRTLAGPAMMGVAVASSQFAVLLYPLFAVLYLRQRRYPAFVVSVLVAGAVILPFYLWTPSAFVTDTLFFSFGREVRPLVEAAAFGYDINPTLAGTVMTITGVAIPLAIRAGATAGVLAILLPRVKNLESLALMSTAFILAVTLILPNDLSWWYLELPFVTLLVWLGLRAPAGASVESRRPMSSGGAS